MTVLRLLAALAGLLLLIANGPLEAEETAQPAPAIDTRLIPVQDASGYWGYMDAHSGELLIPAQYVEADLFRHGLARVALPMEKSRHTGRFEDGREVDIYGLGYGLIDSQGEYALFPYMASISSTNWAARIGSPSGLPKLLHVTTGPKYDAWIPELKEQHSKMLVANVTEEGVFHLEKNDWIVPLAAHRELRFENKKGYFVCDGAFYIGDEKYTAPEEHELIYVNREKSYFGYGRTDREKYPDVPLEEQGIMAFDGRIIVPPRYHKVIYMEEASLWIAHLFSPLALDGDDKRRRLQDSGTPDNVDIIDIDVYNADGKVVFSCKARYRALVNGSVMQYRHEGKEYLYDAESGAVTEWVRDPFGNTKDAAYRVFARGWLHGIQAANGTVTVRPSYHTLAPVGGDLFMTAKDPLTYYENWRGLIDAHGREIFPMEYGGFHYKDCGGKKRIVVQRWSDENGESGVALADLAGNFLTPVSPMRYGNSMHFDSGLQSKVWCKSAHGVLSCDGEEIIPCIYKRIYSPEAGKDQDFPYYIVTDKDDLEGVLDRRGRIVLPLRYGRVALDKDIYAGGWLRTASPDRKSNGLYNIRSGVELPCLYGYITLLPGGGFLASQEQCELLLDATGAELARYERIEQAREDDSLLVSRNNAQGLLDPLGRVLLPCVYDKLDERAPGFWLAKKDGAKFMVDRTGREYRLKDNAPATSK